MYHIMIQNRLFFLHLYLVVLKIQSRPENFFSKIALDIDRDKQGLNERQTEIFQ